MGFQAFSPCQLIPCMRLPLTLMTLDDWVIVNVTGPDSEKYLQSQVTADITKMNEHQHLLTAHCNPKGKVWSNLRLFRKGKGFTFIERRSVHHMQLSELKKYAIFSRVTFETDNNTVLLGVAGLQVRAALKNLFSKLPTEENQVIHDGVTTLLWFEHPSERFVLITDVATTEYLMKALRGKAKLNNSQQWLSLNIEAGIPVIDFANSGKFIPQATNLQILGGISFQKGCYTGQEMVARARFRGTNKRAMWYLSGISNLIPEAGKDIEIKIGDNWRRTGTILAAVRIDDGNLLVQAVMNIDIEPDSVFRVRNDTNILRIQPLPYSLKELESSK